ncbi:MAG: hypothetical protein ABEJ98_02480 [Candidatus Nanohaloarchaea archaeon]
MKGISQVATSVLLIAVAITAVGIYSNWLPEFTRTSMQDIISNQNQEITCSNADISLSQVVYKSNDSITEVNIKNSGTISFREDITVAAVKNSRIIDNSTLTELEVGNERVMELSTLSKPDYVIATPSSCPSIRARRERISTQ